MFCPLISKLQTFEILKWAQGIQCRKQRPSNSTREIQLLFSQHLNTTFYIFIAVKYSFFKICIIFNQYFLYFITLYIMNLSITPQGPVSSLCLLEDGTLLSGGGNEIKAWDTNSNFRSVKSRQVCTNEIYSKRLIQLKTKTILAFTLNIWTMSDKKDSTKTSLPFLFALLFFLNS